MYYTNSNIPDFTYYINKVTIRKVYNMISQMLTYYTGTCNIYEQPNAEHITCFASTYTHSSFYMRSQMLTSFYILGQQSYHS